MTDSIQDGKLTNIIMKKLLFLLPLLALAFTNTTTVVNSLAMRNGTNQSGKVLSVVDNQGNIGFISSSGSASNAVSSINGDTNAAQLIVGSGGITVSTAAGTTTINNTNGLGGLTTNSFAFTSEPFVNMEGITFWDNFAGTNAPVGFIRPAPSTNIASTNFTWFVHRGVSTNFTNFYTKDGYMTATNLATTTNTWAVYPTVDIGYKPTHFGVTLKSLITGTPNADRVMGMALLLSDSTNSIDGAYHFALFPRIYCGIGFWQGGASNIVSTFFPPNWPGVGNGQEQKFEFWIDGDTATIDMGNGAFTLVDSKFATLGGRYMTVELYSSEGTNDYNNVVFTSAFAGVNTRQPRSLNPLAAGANVTLTIVTNATNGIKTTTISSSGGGGGNDFEPTQFGTNGTTIVLGAENSGTVTLPTNRLVIAGSGISGAALDVTPKDTGSTDTAVFRNPDGTGVATIYRDGTIESIAFKLNGVRITDWPSVSGAWTSDVDASDFSLTNLSNVSGGGSTISLESSSFIFNAASVNRLTISGGSAENGTLLKDVNDDDRFFVGANMTGPDDEFDEPTAWSAVIFSDGETGVHRFHMDGAVIVIQSRDSGALLNFVEATKVTDFGLESGTINLIGATVTAPYPDSSTGEEVVNVDKLNDSVGKDGQVAVNFVGTGSTNITFSTPFPAGTTYNVYIEPEASISAALVAYPSSVTTNGFTINVVGTINTTLGWGARKLTQ